MKQDVVIGRRDGVLLADLAGCLAGEHHVQVLDPNCLQETPWAMARCLAAQNRELGCCCWLMAESGWNLCSDAGQQHPWPTACEILFHVGGQWNQVGLPDHLKGWWIHAVLED